MRIKTTYICENCDRKHYLRDDVFNCLLCEKEICDSCMDGWQVCIKCAEDKTMEELETIYNKEHCINGA
jgi:hypothetical protein